MVHCVYIGCKFTAVNTEIECVCASVLCEKIESHLLVACRLKTGFMLRSLYLVRCGWDLVSLIHDWCQDENHMQTCNLCMYTVHSRDLFVVLII